MEWLALAAAAVLFLTTILLLIVLLRRLRQPAGSTMETRLEDLSAGMTELVRIFHTPHTRGVVGETILSELLRSWLPRGQFELQYTFQSGAKADAVVRLNDRLVAVDAKFPMEAISRAMDALAGGDEGAEREAARGDAGAAGGGPEAAGNATGSGRPASGGGTRPGRQEVAEARKALLRHADAIAERYISPAEGTVDFALLYLPSEALYRFLFVEQSPQLFEELGARRVIPVSPGSLFLYIQTMLHALSGNALPADRFELAQQLEGIRTEIHDFATLFYRAGSHLKNATKNFEEAETQLSRIERHFSSLLGRGRRAP